MITGRIAVLAAMLALGACELMTPAKPSSYEVFFAPESTALEGDAVQVVDGVAAMARGERALARVQVLGFADTDGDPAKNVTLSQQRALTVERALVARGIEARRIDAKGMGETDRLDEKVAGRRVTVRFVGP